MPASFTGRFIRICIPVLVIHDDSFPDQDHFYDTIIRGTNQGAVYEAEIDEKAGMIKGFRIDN